VADLRTPSPTSCRPPTRRAYSPACTESGGRLCCVRRRQPPLVLRRRGRGPRSRQGAL